MARGLHDSLFLPTLRQVKHRAGDLFSLFSFEKLENFKTTNGLDGAFEKGIEPIIRSINSSLLREARARFPANVTAQ